MNRKLTIYDPHADDERAMYHFVHLFEQETKFAPEPTIEFLGVIFNLGGTEIKIQMRTSQHILSRNHFAIVYMTPACCELTYAAGKHNFFVTQFEPPYLKKLAQAFPILDGLMENVENKIPTVLNAEHFVITPRTLAEINKVIRNDFTGRLREMFLECKFEDIVLTSLADQKKEDIPELDTIGIAKIKLAYARIKENVKAQHTVSLIADELDLDRRKLEKGFLLLYKTTVHKFIIDERMRLAVGLLRDTTRSISEIAKAVGFRTRKAFTKSFTRKYGYPPSTLRDSQDG